MDRETAHEFQKRIELAFAEMGKLEVFLRPRLSKDDFRVFLDSFGEVICQLDLGILEVLYRAHPDLRPEGMRAVTPLGAGCAVVRPSPNAEPGTGEAKL